MRAFEVVETTPCQRQAIILELQECIKSFLVKNKHLTLNALSKKSSVSEPTLRRVRNAEIKTLPRVNTIVDILSTIYKERNISDLIKHCGPNLRAYLEKVFTVILESNAHYENDTGLSRELKNTTSYLIYKLAANRTGIKRELVCRLFGELGLRKLKDLERKGLVFEMIGSYHARTKSFSLDDELFRQNFQAVSEFIRVEDGPEKGDNLFYNLSESISEEGYQKILSIQRQALKEIVHILNEKEYAGDKPVFVLSSVDHFSCDQPCH
jgi:predicted transcriptional regulator